MHSALRLRSTCRFSAFIVSLSLALLALNVTAVENAYAAGAPVNVPAAVLFVNCPGLPSFTSEVDFYYIKLNGEQGGRAATVNNGGLTLNTGSPTVQFYQVSIDYRNTEALFEFVLDDGSYWDVWVPVGAWGYDRRNGNIWTSYTC